jgi:uncharacterized membrane protein YeaQ/YmgE (transglycosylase-associated protein family)
MTLESILIACVIGAVAGWLASLVIKGGSSGLLRNIIIGIIGGFLGGWLLPMIGLTLGSGYVGAILTSFIGAVVLLLVAKVVVK